MVEHQIVWIGLGWLLGFYFFFRPRFAKTQLSFLSFHPTVSIIIPARNEETNLRILLTSLQHQSLNPLEIIVVNDHSTDATAKVASELGATVLDAPELPPGWQGKSFACSQGAQKARGQFLLFVDADVYFERLGLEKIMNLTSDANIVWSICPYHRIERFYEEFSSIFNLTMIAGSGAFCPLVKNAKLLGQSLLVSKENYERVGGHAAIRQHLLENFFLTQEFNRHQIATRTIAGRGAISMRMFPEGMRQLIQSWKKGFVTGASKTPGYLLIAIILWMSAGISSFLLLIHTLVHHSTSYQIGIAIGMYTLFVIQIRWMYRIIGTFSTKNAHIYPVFMLFFILLFFYSTLLKILGRKTVWKNRHVTIA